MSTRKLELKSLAPKAQGFLRHGDQRRVRRTLRRGPRGVADGQPAKIPAPLNVCYDPPRDTGTKEERLCGLAVEPRRWWATTVETGPRAPGATRTRVFWSRQSRKAWVGQYVERPYRKPTQVGEASSLR